MESPDFIPVLSAGYHDSPKDGACVMEMVSYMSGGKWTDHPECSNYTIAKIAQKVNDTLFDKDRHLIMSQFDRLFNTNNVNDRSFNKLVCEYLRNKADEVSKSLSLSEYQILKGYAEVGVTISGLRFLIETIGPDHPEQLVEILSDVLDVYDNMTGRTEVVPQDITKLKEIQNV